MRTGDSSQRPHSALRTPHSALRTPHSASSNAVSTVTTHGRWISQFASGSTEECLPSGQFTPCQEDRFFPPRQPGSRVPERTLRFGSCHFRLPEPPFRPENAFPARPKAIFRPKTPSNTPEPLFPTGNTPSGKGNALFPSRKALFGQSNPPFRPVWPTKTNETRSTRAICRKRTQGTQNGQHSARFWTAPALWRFHDAGAQIRARSFCSQLMTDY